MKRISFLLFSVFLLLLYGCAANERLNDIYILALETILEEENTFNDQLDYISIFIHDDTVSEKDLTYIKNKIQHKYDTIMFSYLPEEVNRSGPYGKENLAMDGIFLYIMEIDKNNDKVTLQVQKFHTVTSRGSLGMEMVIDSTAETPALYQAEVVWK